MPKANPKSNSQSNSNSNQPAKGQKRGLGKGFDALFPTQLVEAEFDPTQRSSDSAAHERHAVHELSVTKISANPHQPRQQFAPDTLKQLAASIKRHGILQPLVVTKKGERYELVAGERRLRAARQLGLKTVPAIVRSFSEQHKLELALIENLQREDLSPVEVATAYRKLMDEFNFTYQQIASRVGRNRTTVVNTVRLLGLPLAAKRALNEGKLSEGHARAILAVRERSHQLQLLKQIIKHGWTVQQAETYARQAKAGSDRQKAARATAATNAHTRKLAKILEAKVSIQPRAKGGRLLIEYQDEADLERIIGRIN